MENPYMVMKELVIRQLTELLEKSILVAGTGYTEQINSRIDLLKFFEQEITNSKNQFSPSKTKFGTGAYANTNTTNNGIY